MSQTLAVPRPRRQTYAPIWGRRFYLWTVGGVCDAPCMSHSKVLLIT